MEPSPCNGIIHQFFQKIVLTMYIYPSRAHHLKLFYLQEIPKTDSSIIYCKTQIFFA